MKLSIIVPVYNMAADKKLEYCLNSLVNQTLTDYEIIAVDDASTDESLSILRQYEEKYPFFQVIASPQNHKQGGAKNLGLTMARGEWIGFIDSDDWIAPQMYERLIALGEETGADIVGCDYGLTEEHSMTPGRRVANNDAKQTGELNTEKYRLLILDSGSLVVKVYRRQIILGGDTRFPEDIFYEDNAVANTWMLRARRFEYIPEPLYYYYQHENSTVHTVTRERCEHRMKAARIMLSEAKKEGYFEKYYKELEYSFLVLFYINTLFSYLQGAKKQEFSFAEELRREMKQTFPQFLDNPYYKERMPAEEQKLIAMHMQSPRKFWYYYHLKQFYRSMRKRLKKK